MDQKLNHLKDTYKQENSLSFSETDAEQVYQKISDKKINKSNVFHPFPVGLTLAAVMLIGFLFLTNLNEQPLPTGNSIQTSPPTVEGYVVQLHDDRALIVNSETEKKFTYLEPASEIHLGQKIQGWQKKETDSNSPISELADYKILNNDTINDSNLTEAKAVEIAIKDNLSIISSTDNSYPKFVVKSVNYNSEEALWKISIVIPKLGVDTMYEINDESSEIIQPDRSIVPFKHSNHGERFKELEQDIKDASTEQGTILNRIANTNEEQGKGLLNGVAIDEKGTVTIDFQPFEMSLATAEIGKLSNEIKDLAFNYDQTNEIFIQFNGNQEAAYDHLGVEVAPLTRDVEARHQFVDVLNEYESKFRYLVDHNTDGKLEFNNLSEVREFLSQTMSQKLAEDHIESLIRERDDGIYLLATFSPIFINLKKSHEINEIDQSTYQIVQEQNTELRGHLEVTFVIKKVDNEWIINDVKIKDLEN